MTSRSLACVAAFTMALSACGDLIDVPAQVANVAYRPDGRIVVVTTGGIKTYEGDLATETESIRIESPDYSLSEYSTSISQDGQVVAITDSDSDVTRFYGSPGGAPLGSLQPQHPGQLFLILSPSGDKAWAYGESGESWIDSLYDRADGRELWSAAYLEQGRPWNYCQTYHLLRTPPVFTPDGTTMFMAFGEHLVAADVSSGVMHEIANAHACIGAVTLLPDGSLLVLRGLVGATPGYPVLIGGPVTDPTLPDAALPNSFGVYAQDGTLLHDIAPFPDLYTDPTLGGIGAQVACSPVGDVCAMFATHLGALRDNGDGTGSSVDGHGYLVIWRLDGTLLHMIEPPVRGRLAFSLDGTRLAAAFGYSENVYSSARIYSVADGALLAERSYSKGVF